jgi:hypothetical protein
MTSVERYARQVPANALYVNIAACGSSIFTATGAPVNWTGDLLAGANPGAGAVLVRDMGKSVYLPDPTVPASVGSQSTIMRKVQVVRGYYGTGAGASGSSAAAGGPQEYYTGYIKLGGQTYGGGGDPVPAAGAFTWARAN